MASEKKGGVRERKVASGGKRWRQGEKVASGGERWRQGENGGVKRRKVESGGERWRQEEKGGVRGSRGDYTALQSAKYRIQCKV